MNQNNLKLFLISKPRHPTTAPHCKPNEHTGINLNSEMTRQALYQEKVPYHTYGIFECLEYLESYFHSMAQPKDEIADSRQITTTY